MAAKKDTVALGPTPVASTPVEIPEPPETQTAHSTTVAVEGTIDKSSNDPADQVENERVARPPISGPPADAVAGQVEDELTIDTSDDVAKMSRDKIEAELKKLVGKLDRAYEKGGGKLQPAVMNRFHELTSALDQFDVFELAYTQWKENHPDHPALQS